MKIKPLILTLAVLTAITFSACDSSKQSSQISENTSSIAISEPKEGTFDIEYVRKQINIKGQAFEIPMALKDLPEGWTYEEKETSLLDGLGMATFYYEENEMFVGSMENFYDDKKTNGIIYSVFFDTNDCSIDEIVPLKTTEREVYEHYGEPSEKEDISDGYVYSYGIYNGRSNVYGRSNDQRIAITFNKETNIVKSVSITFADLSKKY